MEGLHLDPGKYATDIYKRSGALTIFTNDNAIHLGRIVGNQRPIALTIKDDKVGIGTQTPTKGKLEVLGNILNNDMSAYYVRYDSAPYTLPISSDLSVGIYSEYVVAALGFAAFSDARTKIIEGRSDGARDLQILSEIEVTDYRHKDIYAKGNKPEKKVIAQQLEQVYPQAVNQSTDVVPDIYEGATIVNGWVQLATDLQVGERVRLIAAQQEGIYEVLEVNAAAFRTEFQPADSEVFVYGREVDDFRTVDYDAIAMLNVSATQQLKNETDAELIALEQENAALRAQLQALEARLADIEQRLAK